MTYANILVAVTGAADDELALRAAADLAAISGGVVRILFTQPTENATLWAATTGSAALATKATEKLNLATAGARAEIADLARKVAADHGMTFGPGAAGLRIEMASDFTAWLGLVRHAPLAELMVVADGSARIESLWTGLSADALMELRIPVLVIRGPQAVTGAPAAIAWDGGMAAGRAVRAAIPLLRTASRVVILHVAGRSPVAESDREVLDELAAELDRRGIKPVSTAAVTGEAVGPAILREVDNCGADLLIAGAFQHARLLEALLGGVTGSLLNTSGGPHLFLAH